MPWNRAVSYGLNIGFFIGFTLIAMLDLAIPHQYKAEQLDSKHPLLKKISKMGQKAAAEPADNRSPQYSSLKRTGIFTALGIAIHNLPEGLAVFAGVSTGNTALGLLVATAIALHNIPEGITVSVPIKEATGSSKMAFLISFASGMAEPIGALLGYLILSPFLTPSLIAGLLAFAAGIMVYISLDELIPATLQYGTAHLMILGIGFGYGGHGHKRCTGYLEYLRCIPLASSSPMLNSTKWLIVHSCLCHNLSLRKVSNKNCTLAPRLYRHKTSYLRAHIREFERTGYW